MFFGWTRNNVNNTGATDSGDADYKNDELLGAYRDLTYTECRDIYRYWALGKRMATALPQFAMSAGRKLRCGFNIPDADRALEKARNELQIEDVAYRTAVYSRIYGISFIFASANIDPKEPITYDYMQSGEAFKFNVLDPLAHGGSVIMDLDPLSPTFSQPIDLRVQGKEVHSQRLNICVNDIPLYLKFTPSNFSFSGPSIYQNMTLLIRSWNRAIISIQRLATKASALILKAKDSGGVTNAMQNYAMQKNLEFIRRIENDGIASIKVGEELEFFQLTGVKEVDTIIQKIQNALMMALSDTPSGILLDNYLSTGLADGDNDMKTIIIAVDKFRKDVLAPLYRYLDKFVCYKAYTPELLEYIKSEYDAFKDMTIHEIFEELMNSYNFQWNEIYPQSENEKADTANKRLTNITMLKELGIGADDIEGAINNSDLFGEMTFTVDPELLAQQDIMRTHTSRVESREWAKGIDAKDTEL